MDSAAAKAFIDRLWDTEIIPQLIDYVRIPNKSPAFDPEWQAHGYMDKAVELFAAWGRAEIAAISGATLEVVRLEGRTPVIFIDIPGARRGHGPALRPSRQAAGDARLDRGARPLDAGASRTTSCTGGAAPMTAMRCSARWPRILALQAQGAAHARCVILIEACEESGSYDLPSYIDHLSGAHRLAHARRVPRFRLRQLRPAVADDLAARHGGRCADGPGAGRRRALRRCLGRRRHPASASCAQLLSRIEDEETGEILPHDFAARDPGRPPGSRRKSPPRRWATRSTPSCRSCRACSRCTRTRRELILNRTWRPAALDHRAGRRCRPCRTPAMSCVRRPPLNCPCACRPPWMPTQAGDGAEGYAGGGAALWRQGDVRSGEGRHRLERATARPWLEDARSTRPRRSHSAAMRP